MPNFRIFGLIVAGVAAVIIASVYKWPGEEGKGMAEIKFDLGKNIIETAKVSGVPKFTADDVNGRVSYSINALPAQIPAHFTRAGYDILWQPLFAFTMYADRGRDPSMSVDKVDLQLDINDMTDEAAQTFAEQTIAQFQKGKWKRYAEPDWSVLLTGRSSYLNEAGVIDSDATRAPDPAYKLPKDDWLKVARSLHLRWVGDGAVAELTVNNSPGVDGKPAYRMSLEFELLDVKLKRNAENLARDLTAGDARGWNSTAKNEASKKRRQELNKLLIANALKRGDSVLPFP